MASTVDVVADYLYPLEQSGEQYVVDGRPAEPVNMLHQAAIGEHSAYYVSQNHGRLKRDDRIWFRAGSPEQRVVALGIVQAPAYRSSVDERWRVVIALDFEATKRLYITDQRPTVRAVRQPVWTASDQEVRDLLAITSAD